MASNTALSAQDVPEHAANIARCWVDREKDTGRQIRTRAAHTGADFRLLRGYDVEHGML